MSKRELLITVSSSDAKSLRQLQPTIVAEIKKHYDDIEIGDTNIADNLGMTTKDIVLSLIISVSANFAYDALQDTINDVFHKQQCKCSVEIIELGKTVNINKDESGDKNQERGKETQK